VIKGYEDRIKKGDISLGELALTESDCSSARKRGDLGYFGKGDMQTEFEEAAFALKPGEISTVVDTASGLHLIQRWVTRSTSGFSPRANSPQDRVTGQDVGGMAGNENGEGGWKILV